MLVAVYGSLRQGLYNHDNNIKDSTYKGIYQTEPIYTMIDLSSYPGLMKNGTTSITMEVYEIDDITLNKLDALEGYDINSSWGNFYEREIIKTPWGEAYVYTYDDSSIDYIEVTSGDWKEHTIINQVANV